MQHDERDEAHGNPETGTDDRANHALPVTAEVGGEGGSYADPTIQVATFGRPLDQLEGHGGAASVATQATRSDSVDAGGVGSGPDPADGMLRYPTDDPSTPLAQPPSHRRGAPNWRGGLIGAAAGLAGAAIASRFARRRR